MVILQGRKPGREDVVVGCVPGKNDRPAAPGEGRDVPYNDQLAG
jgi:hypothetical protein